MSDTKTIDQSQNGRSRAYQRLTPETAVLLLIDHQSGLASGVRDLAPDELRHNVVAFARAARVLRVPVVLTSTAPMMWGPTLPELTEALPGVENRAPDRRDHNARLFGVPRQTCRRPATSSRSPKGGSLPETGRTSTG
jgi:nicotinamidase-related amidase